MPKTNLNQESKLDVEALYPELTPEQRQEAAYYLARYLDVVQRIFERVHRSSGLTDKDEPPSL